MHHLFLCPAGNCHRHIRRGLIQTPYGLLDPSPTSPERILDRNSGCGPSQFTANLRLAKTIGIGPLDEGARTQSAPMRTAGQSQSDALNDRGLRNLIGEGFCKHARNRRLELQPRRTFRSAFLSHDSPPVAIPGVENRQVRDCSMDRFLRTAPAAATANFAVTYRQFTGRLTVRQR